MAIKRKNVDLIRLKRTSKRSRFYEFLSSPCVQYLMIFLLWGLLLIINQSTEMRFEYFWPGWLFICSTHDSLKYQGMQYTIIFVIIVLTTDLLFFFLFPASWIYFCGSAYVWIYLLWHTDQGLCFLTLTFCLTFVYFELGFQSRDVKFNHSIYLFRPFAAHSMGYPVVCMGFSIKRYLEVRHRKHKTLNVRRQNCLYFRILREAVPVLQDLPNGTSTPYLPDYDMYAQNSKDIVIQENSDCNLSWSLFVFSQLASSCFSRLGQWCSSYPLPLERELANSSMTNSRVLCSRSTPTSPVNPEDNHITDTCNGLILRSAGGSGRSRQSAATETAHPPCSNPVVMISGALSVNHLQVHTVNGGTPARQTAALKASIHSSSQVGPVTANSSTALTYSRCIKENPVIRLEHTNRRLRAEVQSMRAVESQLHNQVNHLQSENDLNRQSLSSQRQENESMATRISKMNSRSRSERTSLATLEQSIVEEKRLRLLVEEQLSSFGPLASLEGATNAAASSPNNDRTSLVGIDKAIQAIPVTSGIFPGPPDDLMPHQRTTIHNNLSAKVPRDAMDYSCCQRRRLLESEVRSIHQQQLVNEHQTPTAAKSHTKVVGKTNAAAATGGSQRRSRVELVDTDHCNRYPTATGGCSQVMEPNASSTTVVFDPSQQVLVSGYTAASSSSQLQCQRIVLETYLQVAGEERERLARKLREENWMKQDLLTAYHASVKEITDLTNTLKQRDGQINELSQKVEQFERYLSFEATDATAPGGRARSSTRRLAGSKKPGATWLTSPSAVTLGQQGIRPRGKQIGLNNAGHQPLSSIPSPQFILAANAPSLDVRAGVSSAAYSAEDLSLLLLSTSTVASAPMSSVYCHTNINNTSTSAVTSVGDDSANYPSHGFAPQQNNSIRNVFDDFQLTMGGSDFGPSITPPNKETAVSLLAKGDCALRGPLTCSDAAISTAAADFNTAYSKIIDSVPGSGPARQLLTESH